MKLETYSVTPTGVMTDHLADAKKYAKFGGWQNKNNKLVPLKFAELLQKEQEDRITLCAMQWALDSIAVACEHGKVDPERFVPEVFVSKADLDAFVAELYIYDTYWVNERHFWAFYNCLEVNEEQLTTYPSISDAFSECMRVASDGTVALRS